MIRAALIALVKGYRLLLSPWLGSSCRFTPTCSIYSMQALERHGAAIGTYLALARLARCHPWCDGGVDEVPRYWPRAKASAFGHDSSALERPRLFTQLLSKKKPL